MKEEIEQELAQEVQADRHCMVCLTRLPSWQSRLCSDCQYARNIPLDDRLEAMTLSRDAWRDAYHARWPDPPTAKDDAP